MDVGDDGDAHRYSLPTRRPARVGTVAGTVDVTSSRSPHAPAADAGDDGGAQTRARDDTEQRGGGEVEPAHRRRRRTSRPEAAAAGDRRQTEPPLVERRRRRPDLRRAPDEHDVEHGERDEADRERPGRRDRARDLGHRDGSECDERHRRALREQAVREPRDEPERDRERRALRPCGGEHRGRDRGDERERVRSARDGAEDDDPDAERSGGEGDPDPAAAGRPARASRQQDDGRLRRAQHGVRRGEAQGPGVSGRLRMPSVVWNFDQESWSAAISSSTNRGDALIRATTAPGTSPSSTSCSIRAKVSVNS